MFEPRKAHVNMGSLAEGAMLRVQEETRGLAQETLAKFQRLADRSSPLNLNALNDIIISGGSLARKECFSKGVELNATQAKEVRKVLNEIERVVNETTIEVNLEENDNVSLKEKLRLSIAELVAIGNEISAKIPIAFQNTKKKFIERNHSKSNNALYILEELRTLQAYSFRSLGDVNLVTLRAGTLLEDKSYPSSRDRAVYEESDFDKVYCPNDEQKERIRKIIGDLMQSAKNAQEKADEKIVSDANLQADVREKLSFLIRVGQEVMDSTQNKIKEDSQTMVAS